MEALHPKRELPEPEQKSPAIADERKQSTPTPKCHQTPSSSEDDVQPHQKVKLTDVNSSLTCELCKGYLIDATTISECLHSFCRSCIIKFLQENSFCPVCEVIINKAKPNLKLDKALQDIVYKLVPGLFLSEMLRRKQFYADKPEEAGRASPEQRGEDTERTIFNPQDKISLSLEYIGDAATTGLILKDLKQKQEDPSEAESLLKRYLQCPAMCRIDVIKKFIRNKYNVNTDLFQIDILYKRVPLPLPDHYTLIDVAYIYTWKRNEPMRFYFRIIDKGNDELPDLTKVFTPVDEGYMPKPLALSTPNKPVRTAPVKEKNRKTPKRGASKKLPIAKPTRKEVDDEICDKKNPEDDDRGKKRNVAASEPESSPKKCNVKSPTKMDVKTEVVEPTMIEKESEPASEYSDNKVYTNITLNRSNNLEIVTKIQKLTDKDGQQIEVNIIDKNKQKVECKEVPNSLESVDTKVDIKTCIPIATTVKEELPSPSKLVIPKVEPCSPKEHPLTNAKPPTPEVSSTTNNDELERTKFEFLKSIELTAKKAVDNIARLVQQQHQQNNQAPCPSQKPQQDVKPEVKTEDVKLKKPSSKTEPGGVKRKNSSPVKIEPKKAKTEHKRTTKIILQQKPGYPPLNLSKPVEKAPKELANQNRNELRNLFQNCKLNIPASLSITLKENGETSRQPVQMPPVQNFIEILKIDEMSGAQTLTLKREEPKNLASEMKKLTVPENQKLLPKNATKQIEPSKKKRKESTDKQTAEQQSFQRIFEESIKKNGPECKDKTMDLSSLVKVENDVKKSPVAACLSPSVQAANQLVMTQKLQKIAIPRLNNQKGVKPPKKNPKYEITSHQTLANLHSSSLGLNYTVSVGKQQREPIKCSNGFLGQAKNGDSSKVMPSNSLIDQTKLSPSFPSKPSPIPHRNGEVKPERASPNTSSTSHSPRPAVNSPVPKKEQGYLPLPMSSPRIFTPQSSPKAGSKTASPKPKAGNRSPKPRSNNSPNSASSSSTSASTVPPLSANELLEKYNIQNLAQLSASMNYNAQAYLSSMSNKQMSALHQSMLMKQLEAQNRQNWFNINPLPLLQYEKYLQTLNTTKLMGNLKDN